MRLLRITTNYPSYLQQFYDQHPELREKTYAVQYQTLMADCFMWADFWTHSLGKLGYEVWEPVGNAEPMQKVWARENGVSYEEKTWLTDILLAQVKHFQADVVFVFDYNSFSLEFLNYLRDECPSIHLVVGWCGSVPSTNSSVFKAFDLVLSNIPNLVYQFRDDGHYAKYMRHAFEPKILNKIDQDLKQTIDFSFIGSVFKGRGFHNQREQLLKKLVEQTKLQILADIGQPSQRELQLLPIRQGLYDLVQTANYLPGAKSLFTAIPKIKQYAQQIHRPDLSNYVDKSIVAHSQPSVFGISMYQKLYESRITLNNHIDISAKFASNMRLYEATGVGTCLMTDWQDNLHEVFEPDTEVVTYRNVDEAVEKINYLLEHDNDRYKIALAGQHRTLQDHTFDIRAQELDKLIHYSYK